MKGFKKGKFITIAFFMIFLVPVISIEAADVFPSKPITIVSAYAPGSSLDSTARAIAPILSKYLHTNVIISNIPGASGNIGTGKVYAAKPDGYTLLIWKTVLLSEYFQEVNFKTLKFTPIAGISRDFPLLVGHPGGSKNFLDFVKQSKVQGVNIGNNGQYTTSGFQGRLMAQELGMKVNWVNYGGVIEALTSLAGKHIDGATSSIASAPAMLKAGVISPLLVFAKERSPKLPDVPVPSELGFNIPFVSSYIGIVGPPGMDKGRVKILENAILMASKHADYLAWAEKTGASEPAPLSADSYLEEIARFPKVAEKYKNFFSKS